MASFMDKLDDLIRAKSPFSGSSFNFLEFGRNHIYQLLHYSVTAAFIWSKQDIYLTEKPYDFPAFATFYFC
jgi:hypothetical protein